MNLVFARYMHKSRVLCYSISASKNIVLNTKIQKVNDTTVQDQLSKKKKLKTSKKDLKSFAVGPPSWLKLNDLYNPHYDAHSEKELNPINHFFNTSDVKFEWSAASLEQIPGVASNKDVKESRTDLKKFASLNFTKGLPEVAFLGRSNAGKSTLLNSLNTAFKKDGLEEFARASKRAGFTKTLNCFNIGNKLRVIDTPGYGYNSTMKQGDFTMEYLQERKELVRTFLLISGDQGFTSLDIEIVNILNEMAISFEIVFTKMDKVKNLEEFKMMIEESGVTELPTLPQLIYTNSSTSKRCLKRYGIDHLRYVIFQSCGLQPGSRPSRTRK